jgi:hypothetical protein
MYCQKDTSPKRAGTVAFVAAIAPTKRPPPPSTASSNLRRTIPLQAARVVRRHAAVPRRPSHRDWPIGKAAVTARALHHRRFPIGPRPPPGWCPHDVYRREDIGLGHATNGALHYSHRSSETATSQHTNDQILGGPFRGLPNPANSVSSPAVTVPITLAISGGNGAASPRGGFGAAPA